MRFIGSLIFLVLFCTSIVFSQELNREQIIQTKVLDADVLLPDINDLKQAEKEGFEVFRIMPRERTDLKLNVQGGGAYYSFTTKSHDYQKVSQISLEQKFLSTGFAGADYGLIVDLGNVPLSSVNQSNGEVSFLYNYKPPTKEAEVRIEQRRAHNYETDTANYRSRVLYSIGHSYAMRTIKFEKADVLVAFRVHRKDVDGSLIIFWKFLENFEKPILQRSNQ